MHSLSSLLLGTPLRRWILRLEGCGWLVKIKINDGLCLQEMKKLDKPSYTWSSIATTASTLEKGFRWASTETLIHALKDCLMTLAILTCGGLDGRLISNNYEHCIDRIEESILLVDKKVIVDSITILWNS
ncbi:hypothetical protein PVK06_027361 [Gossypium arboreum]|uniref:Uncharacterized protein n=1 Tax=Gossypium arboreum TaxID=29729 RepID=A0ABR0P0D0_GOSAR|nr:hypothetical protein PVK06_027361 [Gossypium arboreum]